MGARAGTVRDVQRNGRRDRAGLGPDTQVEAAESSGDDEETVQGGGGGERDGGGRGEGADGQGIQGEGESSGGGGSVGGDGQGLSECHR